MSEVSEQAQNAGYILVHSHIKRFWRPKGFTNEKYIIFYSRRSAAADLRRLIALLSMRDTCTCVSPSASPVSL